MTRVAETSARQRKAARIRKALLRSWRTSSDREIAGALAVSNRTVSAHRRRLEDEGLILPRPESTQSVSWSFNRAGRSAGRCVVR